MSQEKNFFVYMMTNWTGKILYTGMTSNLQRRYFEHLTKTHKGFTQKYNIDRLVYFEMFSDPQNAITSEKEIKKWRREKKNKLVETKNPEWEDLAISLNWKDPSASRSG